MIFDAASAAVVDASRAITIVHQEHDYAHLPGGRPHYRRRLRNCWPAGAGIFRLEDADWEFAAGGLTRKRLADYYRENGRRTSSPAWARDAGRGSSGWLFIPSRR
jgi:hypothetical protein